MNIEHLITTALKGFGMGAANVIPGVSGGTIALLTGIFGRIVNSLNAIMDIKNWKALIKGNLIEFWENIDGSFLCALLFGVFLSVFTLAKLMKYTLNYYPIQTWAFFFGMILASAVTMLMKIKNFNYKDIIFGLSGIILGIAVCTLSPAKTPDDYWFIFICGAIAICTMILPGISGSFVLLILGKYEYIMKALSELNMPVILIFLFGCLVGLLAFSKLLHWLLSKFERPTMLVLVGFVIGSLIKVWPWNDMGAIAKAQLMKSTGIDFEAANNLINSFSELQIKELVNDLHILGAVIWCISGILLVVLLEYSSNIKSKNEAQNKNIL